MNTIVKKKAKDRRAEIISAAQLLLANEGAGALTLRAVANAVGIKLASLQYHFPTYASLIEALVGKTVETYAVGLLVDAGEKVSPEARLLKALKWFSSPVGTETGLAKLEVQFWALAQTNEDAKTALQRLHDAYIGYFETLIADAYPGFTTSQVRAKAISVVSLFEGSVLFVDLENDRKKQLSRSRDILRAAKAILEYE